MLPTVTLHPAHAPTVDVDVSPPARRGGPPPCADPAGTGLFTDWSHAPEAAAVCARCPAADACLLAALQLHAAHQAGEDPWGITGTCGGVWFQPGQPPRRLPVPPEATGTRS